MEKKTVKEKEVGFCVKCDDKFVREWIDSSTGMTSLYLGDDKYGTPVHLFDSRESAEKTAAKHSGATVHRARETITTIVAFELLD